MNSSEPSNGLPDPIAHRLRSAIENGDNGGTAPAPITNGSNGQLPAGAPIANGSNGRDRLGRFTRGNPGGPGNPFARQLAAFRRALCQTVSKEDIQCLVRQLLERGKHGDINAIKVLFAYAVGRPTDAADPNALDLEEWQLYRQGRASAGDVSALFNSLPAELARAIARSVLPCVGPEVIRNLLDGAGAASARATAAPAQDSADSSPAPAKSAHLSESTVS
jgi:hypothetical protein